MEHLCDTLCFRLDVASFVACVNSGQPWSLKSSILLAGKDLRENEDAQLDSFVENFVLERLSVQSPIRVRFWTEYCIGSCKLDFLYFSRHSKAFDIFNIQ